jgi:hypothetical protein
MADLESHLDGDLVADCIKDMRKFLPIKKKLTKENVLADIMAIYATRSREEMERVLKGERPLVKRFVSQAIDGEYGELTIKNASYLNSLTFSGFKKVYITDAVNLSTVECNDSDNTILKEVVINNSAKLSSLTLPVESLHTLDLQNCNNLAGIKLKGSNYDSLYKLNLIGTKVTKIEFDSGNKDYLDLSRFTNLGKSTNTSETYIKLSSNPDVKCIQFKNEQNKPVYLSFSISNCANLERVYGNISLNCTSCFYQDYKFSIHGSDLTKVI